MTLGVFPNVGSRSDKHAGQGQRGIVRYPFRTAPGHSRFGRFGRFGVVHIERMGRKN